MAREREVPAGWSPLGAARKLANPDNVRDAARQSVSLEASPFFRLGRAHVLSVGGDTCVTLALAGSLFFDLSPGAARSKVALSLVLTVLPFGVVAPFLGPLIDKAKGGRRLMLVGAAAGRAILCLFMAGHVDSLVLFPLVLCSLVLSKAHGVAKASLVPTTVATDAELVRANSRLAILAAVAGFAAAIPAGIVLKVPFLGADWTLRFGALLFLCAGVASFVVREDQRPKPRPTRQPVEEVVEPIVADDAASLTPALTSMAVLRGIVGFVAFEVAFAFRRSGESTAWIGFVLGANAVGNLVGAAVAPRLRKRVAEELIVLGSLILVGVAGLMLLWAPSIGSVALLALAVGTSAAAARLAFDSLVQRDNPAAAQARAFARFEALLQVVWVAGALAPILLSISLGLAGLVVGGTAIAGAVAYGLELRGERTPARKPAPPSDEPSSDAAETRPLVTVPDTAETVPLSLPLPTSPGAAVTTTLDLPLPEFEIPALPPPAPAAPPAPVADTEVMGGFDADDELPWRSSQ